MHYYIYPAGRTGRTLGKMLDYCEMNATYSFIDDSKKGITLKEQASRIKSQLEKNEAEIVIALTQGIAITQSRMAKLIKNLKTLEINRYFGNEFIQKIILRVCQKAQIEVQRLSSRGGGHLLVGVILYGLGDEKHLGNVDYELLKRDCKIVYLDHSGEEFSRAINPNAIVVPFVMDYLKDADFVKYIFSTVSTYSRNANQVYLVQHHSYASVLEALMEEKLDYYKAVLKDKIDYLFATSHKTQKATEFLINRVCEDKKPNVLLSGYAAFDVENEVKENLRDKVLVALHDESEVLEIKESLLELLGLGFKVALRYRYEWRGEIQKFIETIKDNSNFFICHNNENFKNLSSESFTVITSASSVAYTFPIKHLCPAILYFKDENTFEKNIGGIGFFDDRIHFKASNSSEIVLRVRQTKDKDLSKKILKYRDEEVFNFKNASEVIADNIMQIINKEK
ncbi:hypothetical protein [Helicobacter winghamensis]|uniref:hypothetical protein n=1 Tax=Helicobacter winghamensis TaxID=157268 RepID=UPI00279C2996